METVLTVLPDIRKRIMGTRIARSLAGTAISSFGRVISISGRKENNLDEDTYRVAYDDGGSEDLNTLTLFGACWLQPVLSCKGPRRRSMKFLNSVDSNLPFIATSLRRSSLVRKGCAQTQQ